MREGEGWAPGRVNLIGEHTDYNGGFVLPIALTLGVSVTVEPSPALTVDSERGDDRTAAYAAAVCRALGVSDAVGVRVQAQLPVGAGLASSAAFELALARALRDLHDLALEERDLALACHRAENELAPCGVMDQMSAALGRPGAALLIDCSSLDARLVELPREIELAVLDSGARHSNAAGAYGRRRHECEEAARMLGVAVLCEVGPEAAQVPRLPDPLDRRARHVWEENARVIQAVASLGTGDVRALADLMRASHASQRDLFEVSTPEVDHLVERAEGAGALAARLTGGGFGGAVVALCRPGESALVAERAGAVLLAVAQPK